jgi:glutamate N-acetyltransferase/amino-acid N-acetyltransferase
MPVGNLDMPVMHPVKGVRIGITEATIRYKNRRDLTVFEIVEGATVSAVFTQNSYCAAPVLLCREHLAKAAPRYLVINTAMPMPAPARWAWIMRGLLARHWPI